MTLHSSPGFLETSRDTDVEDPQAPGSSTSPDADLGWVDEM